MTARIMGIVDDETATWDSHPATAEVFERLRHTLAGGKRMRALFTYRGWQAAGGVGPDAAVITVAAASELGHACGLTQDDFIDLSATRRGQPALFHQISDLHRAQGWRGSAEHFGFAQALLLANFCWAWASRLLDEAGDAQTARQLHTVNDRMFLDGTFGEHLELVLQSERAYARAQCWSATQYKAGESMFKPPLLMGGTLAGADCDVQDTLGAFGVRIGLAYQLRDDMIGTFGDPDVTGKPNTDDIRDGKPTVMIAEALRRADDRQRERILNLYGKHDMSQADARELRGLLRQTGATNAVEAIIEELAMDAATALSEARIAAEGIRLLEDLAHTALQRVR
ncbi:polyprenyl synthetase family protein [Streptomyces sp. UG1]|uniref:polyprenyl synthetase family protein n=1 Tax=Streptomyces sp. UG1 TaxID=3417652 RepID=UPI003CFA0ACB